MYAPGEELRAYAEHCARRSGLHARTRFGTRVVAATFDEDAHLWTVETDAGDELIVRHVIDATGVLTQPKAPDIEGVESFAGTTLHTARWDEDADLAGKRVAVIGTGASAVQLVPAIADEVDRLIVFQRTPIWCFPKLDAALPERTRAVLGRVPGLTRLARLASQGYVELTFTIAAHYHRPLRLASLFERLARTNIRKQVDDPVLQDKLTPRYAMGCKRPSFHNEYLATYNRDNVALETTPIARITPAGVVTEDGVEHAVDVLVLAPASRSSTRATFPSTRSPAAPGRTSRDGGPSTATRPTRASASRGSPTTSRCSGPTATTARPTST